MTPVAQRIEMHRKDKVRFAEQAWVYTYYFMSFSLGMVSLDPQRVAVDANTVSTSCTTLTTGATSAICGQTGQTARWMASSNGII